MSAAVDKRDLHAQLVAALERDRRTLVAAQQLTSAGVTHEDNRAEGSKDMRATEASYIARGQAQRAEALAQDVARVRGMRVRDFGHQDAIALSALVVIRDEDDSEQRVFVAPAGGGVTLKAGERRVQVVTPRAPLGKALLGRRAGEVVEVVRGAGVVSVEIESVC